ncbi:MAG: hypothetical protein OEW00_07240 [candidate division Zixibacteria bacterium]|nr:hypothetical protein [candidate division Zixibacteria bacterium]
MLKRIMLMIAAPILATFSGQSFAQEIFQETTGQYSTIELVERLPLVGQNKITIRSSETLRGFLSITTADKAEVSVNYFKKAKTPSRSRAVDYIDLIALSLEKTPGGARLELRAPNPAPWRKGEAGIVELELVVPDSSSVEIEAPYFDIEAIGPLKGFVVPSSLGRVDVSDVTGLLEVATTNQRVSVESISGAITVTATNATLAASNITCHEQQARFQNEGGDIRIDGCVGAIDVKNSYGRIDIDNFIPEGNSNYIRGQSEPIIVAISAMQNSRLVIANRYEDIEISVPETISASLSLSVEENGKIEATNFPFKAELVTQTRLNLVAGEGLSLIKGGVRGQGNIYVRGFSEND